MCARRLPESASYAIGKQLRVDDDGVTRHPVTSPKAQTPTSKGSQTGRPSRQRVTILATQPEKLPVAFHMPFTRSNRHHHGHMTHSPSKTKLVSRPIVLFGFSSTGSPVTSRHVTHIHTYTTRVGRSLSTLNLDFDILRRDLLTSPLEYCPIWEDTHFRGIIPLECQAMFTDMLSRKSPPSCALSFSIVIIPPGFPGKTDHGDVDVCVGRPLNGKLLSVDAMKNLIGAIDANDARREWVYYAVSWPEEFAADLPARPANFEETRLQRRIE